MWFQRLFLRELGEPENGKLRDIAKTLFAKNRVCLWFDDTTQLREFFRRDDEIKYGIASSVQRKLCQ